MLIRLWKSYPSFKRQSAFSTWLYRVAFNTAIDIIRKQTIQPKYVEISKNEYNITDCNLNIESDRKDIIYQAINQLSELEKAIIILYLEEYDYNEISEIIGISVSNTGVKINRIKSQLIKILENGQK
jgi:RNA polymerase sigma-70 factor (ECF subfamily)